MTTPYETYDDMLHSDLLTLAKWNDRNGDWDEATTEELISSMKRSDAEDPNGTTLLGHWNSGGAQTNVPIPLTENQLHQVARNFMDKHKQPSWEPLSLDEWLMEHGNHLSDAIKAEGQKIMDAFDNL